MYVEFMSTCESVAVGGAVVEPPVKPAFSETSTMGDPKMMLLELQ